MNWQTTIPVSAVPSPRWQIYTLASTYTKTKGFITIPAFAYVSPTLTGNLVWPRLVTQYNYSVDNAFSFDTIPQPLGTDWTIVLSWRRGDWKVRYKLWGDYRFPFAKYSNDIIHHNFCVEFWHILGTNINLNSDLILFTSNRFTTKPYNSADVEVSAPSPLIATTGVNFSPFFPWTSNPNELWLDNTGTFNELTAGSEKQASSVLPGSYA